MRLPSEDSEFSVTNLSQRLTWEVEYWSPHRELTPYKFMKIKDFKVDSPGNQPTIEVEGRVMSEARTLENVRRQPLLPTRISHQLSAAACDAPHPAVFSRLGVLDGLSSTTPRPARPGRGPQRRPLRAPWPRILGAATTAMSFHRRGAATTKTGPWRRNPSGRWGSRPISSLLVVDDARASTPPRALTSVRGPRRRTALGDPAGPLGRKHHWARHLAALATRPHE